MIFNKRDALFENYRQLVERLSEAAIGLKAGQRTAAFEALYKESEQIRSECEKGRCEKATATRRIVQSLVPRH